ncbi:helix-turn-helix domain-containing protein [Labrys wisconsinensis]|uniref:AraC-like DNA-binding protein n=1 Tax=Labrys wisconsinensis TaxID=425677 RepID=A0ABU0J2F4_9HYPH|nr:helix-turn-helix domain-containing protein [Labrys wisconsinensis]MDQ0467805.1 AraC-like DNA-binding protein [Labrys wisconsinensis]
MRQLDPHQTGNRFLKPDEFLAETHVVEPMPAAHWHDHVELNVITHGGMTYLINGKQVRLQEGAIYSFWAAVPHQVISAVDGTVLVCVYVPFADLLSLAVSSDFKNDLMTGHVLTAPSVDPADALMVARWARDWDGAGELVADILRDEVRLRVRRLAADQRRADTVEGGFDGDHRRNATHVADRRAIARVQEMTSFINAEFSRPINVTDVARVGGLHPTNATATFQRVLGQSIAQYLRQRRLNHAQKLLADTDMAIIEVAFESGHGSLSRFYDAFQRQLSCTPRDYRRRFRD